MVAKHFAKSTIDNKLAVAMGTSFDKFTEKKFNDKKTFRSNQSIFSDVKSLGNILNLETHN